MKLTKIDKNFDNPKYKESKKFKKGGFFSTKKTVTLVGGKKLKTKRSKVLIGTY
ncbi:MAG: hypothetical protein ACHQ1D_00980 [Nitrososphaerales archaeon]